MISRPAARLAAWLAAAVVLVISLVPIDTPPVVDEFNLDKLVHASMYASLMGLFAAAYGRDARLRLALGLVLYGGAIELLQGMTPYRSASLFDALANGFGISIMLGALAHRDRRADEREPPRAPDHSTGPRP